MTGYQEPIEIGIVSTPKNGWQLNAKDWPNFVVPKTQWPVHNTLRQKDEEGLC
jgi:hypothetical protein